MRDYHDTYFRSPLIFFTAILTHNDVQHLKQQLEQEWFCLVRSIADQQFCGVVKESKYELFLAAMPVEALGSLEYLDQREFCAKVSDENRPSSIRFEGSKALLDAAMNDK